MPDRGPELAQRSRIVAPLIAQQGTARLSCTSTSTASFGRFHDTDRDMIGMLASQAAVALDNAQWSQGLEQKVAQRTEELSTANATLKQRAGELAIINAVQEALASELDIQGVYDAVGAKLSEVFPRSMETIRVVDRSSGRMSFPYAIHDGKRVHPAPLPLSDRGFGAEVIRTGRTLLVNENLEDAAKKLGSAGLIAGDRSPKSLLLVPLVMAGQTQAILCLNDMQREHAFSQDDVRLLETLAASMSVALQNAHLFHETQRLLKETEQRAAELAVINSIQQGMAAELDFQAIIDLVGDKLRDVFTSGDIGIQWRDEEAQVVRYLYVYEHGVRIWPQPTPLDRRGAVTQAMLRREPLVVNNRAESEALGIGTLPGTDPSLSSVFVPVYSGERDLGSIALENYEREYAFGDSEIRLLSTVAASMGVALESARLFAETQRLLKETEQRNAELAVIGSIQRGISGSLDFRTIVDLVGDKLREVLRTQDMGIRWLDHATRSVHYLYEFEHGERITIASEELPETRWQALQVNPVPVLRRTAAEVAAVTPVPGTESSLSSLEVPIFGGDKLLGSILVESFEREHAFDEADLRLLQTVGSGMGVALENARLFDETQRLLRETEQRATELAVINSVQEGHGRRAQLPGDHRSCG